MGGGDERKEAERGQKGAVGCGEVETCEHTRRHAQTQGRERGGGGGTIRNFANLTRI